MTDDTKGPKLVKAQLHALKLAFEDLLPHGSGINDAWRIEYQTVKGKRLLLASNTYSAMDEAGDTAMITPLPPSSRSVPSQIRVRTGYALPSRT